MNAEVEAVLAKLRLTTRAANCVRDVLLDEGSPYLEEGPVEPSLEALAALPDSRLLRIPNLGRKTLREIRAELKRVGHGPPPPPPPPKPPSVGDVEGLSNVRPLRKLPLEERKRLTGQFHALPKAKFATEPFVYEGGPAPVPDGTPISVWLFYPSRPTWSAYWVAKEARPEVWENPCVFRVRNVAPGSLPPVETNRLAAAAERIAAATERIADALWGTDDTTGIIARLD